MKQKANTFTAALFGLAFMVFSSSSYAGCSWWNWWKCYTETRYPIVLSHGFLGFDSLLGVVDYWPGIVDRLEDGGATVFVSQVSNINSSEARGEQLIEQIENFLAISGASKVNIIGHSQGGLDARYVASVRPDLVASITTVGSPHTGGVGDSFGGGDDPIVTGLISALGDLIGVLSGNGNDNNAAAAVQGFTAAGTAAFNANYPIGLPTSPCGSGPGVVNVGGHDIRIYSWGGTSVLTNALDPSDVIMGVTSLLVGGDNDGLVARCDNHLGTVLRDNYRHNHLDLTNLMFGLTPLFESDPKSVFRAHANRLKNAGL
ncbi:MAG: triacylglycerol lipase [Pseudomonadota bacterium]